MDELDESDDEDEINELSTWLTTCSADSTAFCAAWALVTGVDEVLGLGGANKL